MFDLPLISARNRSVVRELACVWPLPDLDDRAPVVVSHDANGVELAYERAGIAPCGTATHFMPSRLPAFAVKAGKITYAGKRVDGYAILLDHENGWATYYANLDYMFVVPTTRRHPRTERVRIGDALGHVGASTSSRLGTLRFELWRLDDNRRYKHVDPRPFLATWPSVPWIDGRFLPRHGKAT